jgi:hypothetical protein
MIKKKGGVIEEDIEMPQEEEKKEILEDDESKKVVTIEYVLPKDFYSEPDLFIQIVGTFTNWVPEDMEECKDTKFKYFYEVSLKRGFKHRYQFLVNGDEVIDMTKKHSANQLGNETNYIMVPLEKKT